MLARSPGCPQSATPQQKEFIEQTANMVAADNVELACCFIQKTAIEKAIQEIDKRLGGVSRRRRIVERGGAAGGAVGPVAKTETGPGNAKDGFE